MPLLLTVYHRLCPCRIVIRNGVHYYFNQLDRFPFAAPRHAMVIKIILTTPDGNLLRESWSSKSAALTLPREGVLPVVSGFNSSEIVGKSETVGTAQQFTCFRPYDIIWW